jgi:uncharacterized protein YbaP (TraB family)
MLVGRVNAALYGQPPGTSASKHRPLQHGNGVHSYTSPMAHNSNLLRRCISRRNLAFAAFLLLGGISVTFSAYAEDHNASYPVRHCPATTPEPAAEIAPVIPFGTGLLFRIEKAGVVPSHVFGTIHLDDPHLQRLPPPLNVALLNSSRLIMETLTDDASQATFQQRMRLSKDESLTRWLGGDLLARYRKLAKFYRVQESLALNLKPWAATSLIGRPRPNSGRTMEDAIRSTAEQMGKSVFALESMDELIGAEEEQSIDEQVSVLVDTLCQHPRVMKESVDLLELYANEDLAGIAWQNEHGHENDALFQRMNERMLYKRSEQMVERLQEHLQAGGVVVAIGALHLAGERGVLRLLEKQGYTITREF